MAETTGISWTDATYNPWWGCVRHSPGCTECYAEDWAARFGYGWGPQARRRFFGEKHWSEPLKWNRTAEKLKKRMLVFCASMADVFEVLPKGHDDAARMSSDRGRLFELIERTPALTWLLLTKRPEEVVGLIPEAWTSAFPANVWMGTTVEDRERLFRLDHLRGLKAAVRFISVEPQLEDLGEVDMHGIDWCIVGGESGDKARPFDLQWARNLRRQCAEQGVAYFFKQKGHNVLDVGQPLSCNGKGADPSEWPESICGQDFPVARAA